MLPGDDGGGIDAAAADASADLTVGPPYTLSVTITGSGTGAVASSPSGIQCSSGTCAAQFSNQMVTLTATVAQGSYFAGWAGDCARAQRSCVVAVNQARSVTATFAAIEQNLVFVSSQTYAANLGSAAMYDQRCNQLATAAGINSVGNNAYVALMRDGSREFVDVLGTARGFVRVDGAPIADTVVDLVNSSPIYNNIGLDENGVEVRDGEAMNGIGDAVIYTCQSWTTNANNRYLFPGNTSSGPLRWIYSFSDHNCSDVFHVYCFMKTRTVALTPATSTGKKIYLTTNPFFPGGGIAGANAQCDAYKPMGTSGTGKALLATTTASAASLLHAVNYVRPDGLLVGSGAELSLGIVHTGIWQRGDGGYVFGSAWSGTEFMTQTASANNNCNDWTSSAMGDDGLIGDDHSVTTWWSNTAFDPGACSTGLRIRCFEE